MTGEFVIGDRNRNGVEVVVREGNGVEGVMDGVKCGWRGVMVEVKDGVEVQFMLIS